MIGYSKNILLSKRKLKKVAQTDLPILIQGETGTGKEIIANWIHKNSGRKGKLQTLNCSAISPEIIESELFGHKKGSFTGAFNNRAGAFQSAHKGTLFLDEIGDMPLNAQAKLLRVLETGEIFPVGSDSAIKVDFRIIAATNQKLKELIEQKKFRQDLYYRLNILSVHLKPLRERKEDLKPLVKYFFYHYSRKYQKNNNLEWLAIQLFFKVYFGVQLNTKINIQDLIELVRKKDILPKTKTVVLEYICQENPFIFSRNLLSLFLNKNIINWRGVCIDLFLTLFKDYPWPGNVRELKAVILKMIVNEEIDWKEFNFFNEDRKKQEKGKYLNKNQKNVAEKKEQAISSKKSDDISWKNKREKIKEIVIARASGRIGYAFENFNDEFQELGIGSASTLYDLVDKYDLKNNCKKAKKKFLEALPPEKKKYFKINRKQGVRKLRVSYKDLKDFFS